MGYKLWACIHYSQQPALNYGGR